MKATLQTLFSFIFIVGAFAMSKTNAQITEDFDTPTPTTRIQWAVPPGVTSLTIEAWGAGGCGGKQTSSGRSGGGGGGAFSRTTALAVSPGQIIYINVGAGGVGSSASPSAGGDSWARVAVDAAPSNTSEGVLAKGGGSVGNNTTGGATGGASTFCVGDDRFNGGNGATAGTPSGGGGSSAGLNSIGVNGSGVSGGIAPAGGGDGGNGIVSGAAPGDPGFVPGGGGGGARRLSTGGDRNGGNGATGKVSITYTTSLSNTITTGAITGSPFCVTSANGATVNVDYTASGTFNGGNVFSAQLSNSSGVFPALPSDGIIGTLSSTISGTITGTIPAGTAAGSGYLIRVLASDPSTTSNNSSSFQVISAPANVTALSGSSEENQVPLTWTNPAACFDQILVVASTSSIGGPPTGTPTANANFTSGTALLGGFAVYSGTGTNVTVTGLTNGTPYFFKVFTRTGSVWSAGVQTSVTPAAPPPDLSAFSRPLKNYIDIQQLIF